MNKKDARKELYSQLEKEILSWTNSPIAIETGILPNNNILVIKDLANLPNGGHYDLPYLYLMEALERANAISPGQDLFENTSGSAGRSFIQIAQKLGYNPHVAIPAGGEKARLKAIQESFNNEHKIDVFDGNPENAPIILGDGKNHIILTPKDKYVNGFLELTKPLLIKNRRIGAGLHFLNHSQGPKLSVNEAVIKGFGEYAKQALNQIVKEGLNLDTYIAAIGNGSSLLGPGRFFKENNINTTGFEPAQAGLAYNMLKPQMYEKLFGIKPGTLPRSMLPGLSFSINGKHIPVPHIQAALNEKILDDVLLVSDKWSNKDYQNLGLNKEEFLNLIRWDTIRYNDAGRTTRAAISTALELAKSTQNKTFLVFKYDTMDKYDNQH